MKSLHLVALGPKEDGQEAFKYIQVKDGFVHATNGAILIKMPITEVFGEGVVTNEDELYFSAKEWKANKLYKASEIKRKVNEFIAHSKTGIEIGNIKVNEFIAYSKTGIEIGNIRALTKNEFYEELNQRYPDVNVAIPEKTEEISISRLNVNPALLNNLCTAFNEPPACLQMVFSKNAIRIWSQESETIGAIMPMRSREFPYSFNGKEQEEYLDPDYSDLL